VDEPVLAAAVDRVIERVSAVMALAGDAERAPWLFARSWLAECRYEAQGQDLAVLEAAVGDFHALPRDFPSRAKLAAMLVNAQFSAGRLDDSAWVDRMAALAEIAQADPRPAPQWPKLYAVVRAQVLQLAVRDGRAGFRPQAGLAELEKHARVVGAEKPFVHLINAARVSLRHAVAVEGGDLSQFTKVGEDMSDLVRNVGADSLSDLRGKVFKKMAAVMDRVQHADLDSVGAILKEVMALIALLPPEDSQRVSVEQTLESVRPLLDMLRPGVFPNADSDVQLPPDEALRRLGVSARLPGLSDTERAMRLATLATAYLAVGTLPALALAADCARETLELASEHDSRRSYYLMTAGLIHARRAEMTGDRSGAEVAAGIAFLEQARKLAGSSTHVHWTLCSNPLAKLYRLSGRKELSRQVALSGLRGHAWNVLLQSNIADMHAAARDAAGDAIDVARWCLDDNAPGDAAVALDMGRGLILYAANESRDIETRLTDLGRDRLAAQWHQARQLALAHEVPAELRRQVVSALAGVELDPDGAPVASPGEASTRLLDAPSTDEMRAALRSTGMDALVYLLPGDDKQGAAVIVRVAEEPSWVLLPGLNTRNLAGFEQFMADSARSAARGAADVDPREPNTSQDPGALRDLSAEPVGRAVDEVCDWAWKAVVGPLLTELPPDSPDRPVRIVLIPMRELSRVPWHAARYREGGKVRYAVERAVFSYAVSARMFCESAWRSDVPLTDSGLVVGDPDTARRACDLPAARAEARAVRDGFYPAARYVGRRADGGPGEDGAGDPGQILAWLADPAGGPMIHLACHGVNLTGSTEADTSYLLLHQGRHLAAEELVRGLIANPGRDLALAILAACRSAESGRGYDEAFSLATTLLANNTRTVISAQWAVPDAATSVLMFMFHHYLRAEGLKPVDALREAQLWMIGDREPPEAMPPELTRRLAERHASEVANWAAFIHAGR
jgi:CHAT domain